MDRAAEQPAGQETRFNRIMKHLIYFKLIFRVGMNHFTQKYAGMLPEDFYPGCLIYETRQYNSTLQRNFTKN